MKHHLKQLVEQAIAALYQQGVLPEDTPQLAHIARARNSQHGDFASNSALKLAQSTTYEPRELAAKLCAALPSSTLLAKTEIAGPGFINFFVSDTAYRAVIDDIRQVGKKYGASNSGAGQKVLLEFVSANPTGPLHVGHGRGAAYGDALARVLRSVGYQTHCEYYVNDSGRQMDILAVSIWLRYLEARTPKLIEFPHQAYQGAYICALATGLKDKYDAELSIFAEQFAEQLAHLPAPLEANDEAQIDALIATCKALLGDTLYQKIVDHGCQVLVQDIRNDLSEFGVCFDNWFSDKSLHASGDVARALAKLEESGYIYTQDGAKWFKSSDFGDEKDRAVCRANGSYTYFATDIAYHFNKSERGFDKMVDVFGADHHGYAKRIMAASQALAGAHLQIVLVQFVALYRQRKKVPMSTRSGEFITLRELRTEIGNDAARFFYVSRKNDQHIEFDIELAKAQSADNPVYYIQYAHARIHNVFKQLVEKKISRLSPADNDYALLCAPQELELMKTLSRFPEVVEQAATELEPHLLTYYLRMLANDFHTYYNAHPFLASEAPLREARLGLIDATRQVIANGLDLLGVDAPVHM